MGRYAERIKRGDCSPFFPVLDVRMSTYSAKDLRIIHVYNQHLKKDVRGTDVSDRVFTIQPELLSVTDKD